MRIQSFLETELEKYDNNYELAGKLGISDSMLAKYRLGHTKQPSLQVARRIYELYALAIWPYSTEGVKND